MNLQLNRPERIAISLSRRNLLTLLKMLDTQVGMPVLHRRVQNNPELSLTIRAEEDAEHYASEDRQSHVRGVMGVGPEDVERRW